MIFVHTREPFDQHTSVGRLYNIRTRRAKNLQNLKERTLPNLAFYNLSKKNTSVRWNTVFQKDSKRNQATGRREKNKKRKKLVQMKGEGEAEISTIIVPNTFLYHQLTLNSILCLNYGSTSVRPNLFLIYHV